jgi:myosin-1
MANTGVKRRLAQDDLDDLVMIEECSNMEGRILSVLKNRYGKELIYTNIGPVLIAVNPFKTIPSLTTEARIREYQGKKYFEMPPHPYAVTEEAFSNMNSMRENQCIIISGESGAGKTETAKIILQYISSISGKGSDLERVKNRFMASNPILEGFGNAKTINNNNSSRFGKYMVLHFNYAGEAIGGHISNYLLEKSRVVGPALDERNFHVFYQLTSGASQEERAKFYIENTNYYRYLNSSGCTSVHGIDDIAEWRDMSKAFETVGITPHEREEILRVLSIILWLGNVDFIENEREESMPSEMGVIDIIAHLMQVDPQVVVQGLCVRTITAGGARAEMYKKPCRREEAEFNRDTLAKAMYSKLFDFLVSKINASIQPPSHDGSLIGILDIFGFEIFEHNSFEQLCINFVNEKLQQIFIELTLKTEQEEYRSEGIPWTDIAYNDNKPVCDLIEGRPGLLTLLDDVCATNKNEIAFVGQINQQFATHPAIKCGNTDFVVKHYAGDVRYDSVGFTIKNKDTLFDDLVVALQHSPCQFVDHHGWRAIDTAASQKARPPTVGRVFKEHVKSLMTALMECTPHYIRCIKPNHAKAPGRFDTAMIARQVQYLGLLENVRVRRAGYAYRATFERFGQRYGILSEELVRNNAQHRDPKARVDRLISELGWQAGKQFAMGKTKIFIREAAVLFSLEELLERKVSAAVTVMQTAYRFYLSKRSFLEVNACGYDVMKEANKERRRASLSGNTEFKGDYLFTRNCQPVQQLLAQYTVGVGATAVKEEVMFADKVQSVVLKEKKGLLGSLFTKKESLHESRLLLATAKAVYCYTLALDPADKTTTVVKLYWRVELGQIKHITMSPFSDGYLCLHFAESLGIKDTLILLNRKTEFLAAIRHAHDYPSSQGKAPRVPVSVATSDRVMVNAKKQTFVNISWSKDEMVTADIPTIVKDKKTKQDIFITVASGTPMSHVPEPFRPAKVDYSTGGRVAMRCITAVTGNGVDELAVHVGDVVYVVRDDDKGWVQAETVGGSLGWVPKNVLEYVDPSINSSNNVTVARKTPAPPAPPHNSNRPAPPAPPSRPGMPARPVNAAFGSVLSNNSAAGGGVRGMAGNFGGAPPTGGAAPPPWARQQQ